MVFRRAQPHEIDLIFMEGYKEWRKNRSFEQYCLDNGKEDAYGTRYVLDVDREIVCSAILLKLNDIHGQRVFGIGSVLTAKTHEGKGYATELLNNCIMQVDPDHSLIFLYSDINPAFYKRLGFRTLPLPFQKYEKSKCMVKCRDDSWNELINCTPEIIPSYF